MVRVTLTVFWMSADVFGTDLEYSTNAIEVGTWRRLKLKSKMVICAVCFVDYLTELNEWGPIFTLWSNSEDRLNKALTAMAKSVEKCFLALQEMVS